MCIHTWHSKCSMCWPAGLAVRTRTYQPTLKQVFQSLISVVVVCMCGVSSQPYLICIHIHQAAGSQLAGKTYSKDLLLNRVTVRAVPYDTIMCMNFQLL